MVRKLVFWVLMSLAVIARRNMTIFGNSSLGYYYLEAYVGTPPQKKSLIIDTGSHLTIFPCGGCTKCRNHIYKVFNTTASRTFKDIDPEKTYFGWQCADKSVKHVCKFEQGYTEGSDYSGYFGIDNFLFENELNDGEKTKNHRHIFGCAMKETGEFYTQEADGIIGIGVAQTTRTINPPTILDIELMEKRIDKQTFAICIAKNGGEFSLGDWNSALHLPSSKARTLDCEGLKWTEQFNVHISDIQVGNKSIDYDFEGLNKNGGKAFLDTGTTFVYFSPELFGKFMFFIGNFCAEQPDRCGRKGSYQECYHFNKNRYKDLNEFYATFPKMTFKFNGDMVWDWFPQDYLVQALDSTNHFCIGVKSLKDIILGAVFMRNYDIYFDKLKKQVSFVRSNCGRTTDTILSTDDNNDDAIDQRLKSKMRSGLILGTPIVSDPVVERQKEEAAAEIAVQKLKPDFAGVEEAMEPPVKIAEHHRPKPVVHTEKKGTNLYLGLFYYFLAIFAACSVIVLVRFLLWDNKHQTKDEKTYGKQSEELICNSFYLLICLNKKQTCF